MDWWLTFLSGGGAGAAVLYLGQRLFEHRLAKDLAASNRRADAARDFRSKVNEALALFHKPEGRWPGDNRTAHAMRSFVSTIDLAAKDFIEFLPGSSKTKFANKWQETKEYCSTTLPRAVTGNDVEQEQAAKAAFLKHVDGLLSLAKT